MSVQKFTNYLATLKFPASDFLRLYRGEITNNNICNISDKPCDANVTLACVDNYANGFK